jgi:hypothetical protein
MRPLPEALMFTQFSLGLLNLETFSRTLGQYLVHGMKEEDFTPEFMEKVKGRIRTS